MSEKDKKRVDQEEEQNTSRMDKNKTELAQRIAKQSKKMAHTYEHVEGGLFRVIRWFSTLLDKLLFNSKHIKLTAFVLAVLMYVVVNYNNMSTLYTTSLQSSRTLDDVAVSAEYNSDTFEVSGLPETVNVTITGDATNVVNAASSGDGKVVADLEGLTEGQHTVKLTGSGYGDNVTVVTNPSTAVVTLKKKTTQQFDVSYDFINQDKMDSRYSPGTPEFESSKVNVRASRDKLDTIAFVKALIDVSGQTADFEQDARLVAYDSDGNPVEADIIPDTIHVKVPVTSPNKAVPIEVQVNGDIPDNKAIESITMDQQSVTIYGSETALANIQNVVVTLDAKSLTKDSTVVRPIVLPSGVSSASVTQVTMNVTLGDAVSKTIDNVPINVINNTNHYKASQPDNITTASVTVTGTQSNIDQITADDINVYIDMKDAQPGLQTFRLQVDQPDNGLVKYTLIDTEYELNVLGEKTEDTDTNEGADVNNE